MSNICEALAQSFPRHSIDGFGANTGKDPGHIIDD